MSKATKPANQQYDLDLRGRDFTDTDFSGDFLNRRQFQNSDLTRACFRNSTLTYAEFCDPDGDAANDLLTSARGLTVESFPGSDLTGATLPESLKEFPQIKLLDDASKEGSKILFTMILVSMFCLLSVGVFNDAALLANNAVTSALPGIGLTLPIFPFIVASPFLLLGFHIYFLLALQHYEEIISSLPAIFPDGIILERKVYPWLFSSLATNFRNSYLGWRGLSFLNSLAAIFLAHLLIPLTIWIIWFRALCSHSFAAGTTLFALGAAIVASCFQFVTGRAAFRWGTRSTWPKRQIFPLWMTIVSLILVGCFSLGVYFTQQADYGAIKTHPAYAVFPTDPKPPSVWQDFLLGIGDMQTADISSNDLTKKPASWTGKISEDEQELRSVTSPDLSSDNLRYMRAFRAFIVNGQLAYTDLTHAVLAGSDLRGADLRNSKLIEADLKWAKVSSIATPTKLDRSDMSRADLSFSDLSGATFYETSLKEAKFEGAVLDGSNLRGSKEFTWKQLLTVKSIDFETALPLGFTPTFCRDRKNIKMHLVSEDGKYSKDFTVAKPPQIRGTSSNDKWQNIWELNKKECPSEFEGFSSSF